MNHTPHKRTHEHHYEHAYCPVCGRKCHNENSLRSHRLAAHERDRTPEACPDCGRMFTPGLVMTQHRRAHNPDRIVCDCGCGRTFKGKGGYARHRINVEPGNRERRFWAKVDKNGPNGCWLWTAWLTDRGYGIFYIGPGFKQRSAHLYSYEIAKGPIPEGLEVDHLCRTPACVNPDHLEAVPHEVNMQRALDARKPIHCERCDFTTLSRSSIVVHTRARHPEESSYVLDTHAVEEGK